MSGSVIVWKQDGEHVNWTQHATLSMSDLLWLVWWRSDVNKPQVLLAGSEDGLVAACLIVEKSQDRPPKYLAGKLTTYFVEEFHNEFHYE